MRQKRRQKRKTRIIVGGTIPDRKGQRKSTKRQRLNRKRAQRKFLLRVRTAQKRFRERILISRSPVWRICSGRLQTA